VKAYQRPRVTSVWPDASGAIAVNPLQPKWRGPQLLSTARMAIALPKTAAQMSV
jgi:hypothetical protein